MLQVFDTSKLQVTGFGPLEVAGGGGERDYGAMGRTEQIAARWRGLRRDGED
jgi:hypothetical protein